MADLLAALANAVDRARAARRAADAGLCGAEHPTNASVVPCGLFGGHPGPHYSTTGCGGSSIEWRDPAGGA